MKAQPSVDAQKTEATAEKSDDVDVNELVFGHIGDAYEWHIATLGHTELSIPLPVIVKASDGWHVFSSARLKEGASYEGLHIAKGGNYDGKNSGNGSRRKRSAPHRYLYNQKRIGTDD